MPRGSSTSVRVFYPRLTSEEIIARLRAGVLELERSLPLIRLVLFGSYAARSYTVGSDIDLLVVHEGKPRPDAYRLVKQAMGFPRVEPHVYTEQEAEASKGKLEAMLRHSVPIYP
ncbi:MAG TPA: nucleotidyltransferase domain-containing protein [Anaerolineales bacterium]|nr:nucleotidyltransferase domain-containing protein [Anaerolineales bacterium]